MAKLAYLDGEFGNKYMALWLPSCMDDTPRIENKGF
jgi:hypothetical protein